MHVEDLLANLIELLCAEADYPVPAPFSLVVAPHPEDEVIGLGGRLQRIRDGAVIHVTDGAPRNMRDAEALGFHTRDAYARARWKEMLEAVALAGLVPDQCIELGMVDQEASLDLPGLAHSLAEIFMDLEPEVVLIPAFEGGHPDHDATAFGVHAACSLMEDEGLPPPVMIEYALYHAGREGEGMATFEFLPDPDRDVKTMVLHDEAEKLKKRMMECFFTQRAVISAFPANIERFRVAPAYNFTKPPHPGKLFYEHFAWGVTGERWRALARKALDELDLREPL